MTEQPIHCDILYTDYHFTLRYVGSNKYIIKHFNYSVHKVIVRRYKFYTIGPVTVIFEGNNMGAQEWEQFFEDWQIIDRRVLIEKARHYL